MLTVADMTGAITIRALVNLVLDDGRRLDTGETAQVSPEEAERHYQRAAASIALAPKLEPRACSARRDELWRAGIR